MNFDVIFIVAKNFNHFIKVFYDFLYLSHEKSWQNVRKSVTLGKLAAVVFHICNLVI